MTPKTITTGGYVYRYADNKRLGKIAKDAAGVLYGTPSHRDPSSTIDRVYGTRKEIVAQLHERSEAWDRMTRPTK